MDDNQSQLTTQTPQVPKSGVNFLSILAALIVGLVIGFFATNFVSSKKVAPQIPSAQELVLPTEATQIQVCADNAGALYIRSRDIPVGPIYMVNSGKVIGIRFMLDKEDFLAGKPFRNLLGLGIKVDHVNVGLLPQGHLGLAKPHYHIDIYNVSKSVEEGIKCTGLEQQMMMATPSGQTSTHSAR